MPGGYLDVPPDVTTGRVVVVVGGLVVVVVGGLVVVDVDRPVVGVVGGLVVVVVGVVGAASGQRTTRADRRPGGAPSPR